MPELPEVEVTRMGVSPYLIGQRMTGLTLRRSGLRWPFPENLHQKIVGYPIQSTARRGKYLLINFEHGVLIIHLGMSGHLRVLPSKTAAQLHDHVDFIVGSHLVRFTDPRRFGAVLWHDNQDGNIAEHKLLQRLGMEPFSEQFNAQVLFRATRRSKMEIKQMLLAGKVVVGVGNIYASECLFLAGISPFLPVNKISLARYKKLVVAIQQVLADAITKGGSTLRDFVGVDGESGYFQQNYDVYDRNELPCRKCNTMIQQVKQGQRSTFYCVKCQK